MRWNESTWVRFWSKVDVRPGCWEWSAHRDPKGYGRFKKDGRAALAHRIAYEFMRGSIPNRMEIDHLCMNTSCVNPEHMEVVTTTENVRRRGPTPGFTGHTHKKKVTS